MKTFCFSIFAGLLILAQVSIAGAKTLNFPEISLKQAVDLAENYLKEKKIDVSDKVLLSAEWLNLYEERKEPVWSLRWQTKGVTRGGELVVSVKREGIVTHAFGQ